VLGEPGPEEVAVAVEHPTEEQQGRGGQQADKPEDERPVAREHFLGWAHRSRSAHSGVAEGEP
jgi:hypothetical protein